MWIEGTNPKEQMVDYNQLYLDTLKGELTDEVARETLGRYLMYNMGILVYMLTGFMLEPYQRIVIKGWMQKNFSLCVAGRGFSKSFLASHFCYLYSLFNPDHHTLVVSATFRSSRRILDYIEAWALKKRKIITDDVVLPGGELLLETFARKMEKKPDMYKIWFKNGSTITAVPLGDPDNLRGFRCNALVTDETLLIPQATIDTVLKPFLVGSADITGKQRVRLKEDQKIADGLMKESERRKFKASSKMINLSSASYRWEELYQTYKKYLKIINPDPDGEAPDRDMVAQGVSSYLVQQLSYKVVREDLMDEAIMKEIKDKLIPENVIKREYEAQFVDESGGYFSAREMNSCTVETGQQPSIEMVGDKTSEYILGVDPSIASSDSADHFAMCVIKVVPRKADGKKVGLVVHQYACCGVELKFHIQYLYYLLVKFQPVYIVCDTTQGDNADFINICNESEYFKARNLELNPIAAEFTNESFSEIVKQVNKSYNPDSAVRRIVQKQFFSSPIIKAGNEYLRACFDQRLLWFPSHAQSVPNLVPALCQQDVMEIHKTHPEFCDAPGTGGNMYEFVTYQDNMIELVKKELALIEVTATPLGNLTFDLPHIMTRNRKNIHRVRKDSYSALWLANWGLKIYLAAQQVVPVVEEELPSPRWIR